MSDRRGVHIKYQLQNMTVRNHLEEKVANGNIILKRIYKKWDMISQNVFNWLRIRFSGSFPNSVMVLWEPKKAENFVISSATSKTGPSRFMATINAVNKVNWKNSDLFFNYTADNK